MFKKIFLVLLITGTVATFQELKAQDAPARPDVPGELIFDIGFNTLLNNDVELFETSLWGSKTFNVYYMYDIQLFNSQFSFLPGIGLGLDKFDFDNAVTVDVPINQPDTTVMVNLFDALGNVNLKKTRLATGYLDIPFEFRYYLRPNDPKSFRVGIGGKAGVLIGAHTKIKYERGEETVKVKDKRDFNISGFRYGFQARVGVGSFNLYAYYGLNEFFEDGDGPDASGMNQLNIGLSIVGF